MDEHITNSPLYWPQGWSRTAPLSRIPSPFINHKRERPSIAKATRLVIEELWRYNVRKQDIIISTDLKVRLDGLPYSSQRAPDDVGAAVWWMGKEGQQVLAIDQYNRIGCNIYAVYRCLDALRAIPRWGGRQIQSQAFKGFKALPGTNSRIPWRKVFDYEGHSINQVLPIYKRLRSLQHPDNSGSDHAFNIVQQAWLDAKEELTK